MPGLFHPPSNPAGVPSAAMAAQVWYITHNHEGNSFKLWGRGFFDYGAGHSFPNKMRIRELLDYLVRCHWHLPASSTIEGLAERHPPFRRRMIEMWDFYCAAAHVAGVCQEDLEYQFTAQASSHSSPVLLVWREPSNLRLRLPVAVWNQPCPLPASPTVKGPESRPKGRA